ncbi:pyridoxal-phosphate dependent enzyme [Amycolatopsis rubida]|uniref:Pyridoxal-phosphate dependent enzyme n=1 Tax=Amycolatopsis rubida TaxID=112413 RepID=A0ABX0BK87_9PSEU|nr:MULTISPECIES: pyridoxal-phosphate dependent enzyme [Amycolatopsis]MYW90787.1 pyridoxal-phosphate dependent enzyme [Amycolatopsis rubida]NEC55770.1 pyridoxal-phosphate dependent enzyme [Amycolatopsis rubida]
MVGLTPTSWRKRRVVSTDSTGTIANGVVGRHPIPAALAGLLQVADDAVLVQEASIVTGMRMLHEHAGLIVEPSAALGVAAIIENPGGLRRPWPATGCSRSG